MEVVPSDTRYIPLTQQRYCCVPTCIQMVMYRRNILLVPAELLGYYLGLIIPKKELKLFWNARTGKKPSAGYGTQIDKKEYNPNTAFKKLGIPLQMKLKLIDEFENITSFKNYLETIQEKDKDVIICYDYGTLFNIKSHNGHVCLIDRIYMDKNDIRMIDPWYLVSKWRIVKINKLFKAMKFHGAEKSGGFWELI